MAKYRVNGHVSGGKYLGVFEAETPAEAVKLALESAGAWVSFCHQCAGQCEDPQINDADADLVEGEESSDE